MARNYIQLLESELTQTYNAFKIELNLFAGLLSRLLYCRFFAVDFRFALAADLL